MSTRRARSPAGSAASCRPPPGAGASRSRSSSRSRRRRAGSAMRSGNRRVMSSVKNCGRVRLGAVDAGGAADDDRPHRRRLLERGQQLERADHVDVVHRPRRTCRPPAAARSGCARPCRPRAAGSASRSPGCGCRPRSTRSARAPAVGARVSSPATYSTRRVALEPRGQLGAEVTADAGDQHPAAGHQPARVAGGLRLPAGLRRAGRRPSIASSRRPMARNSAFSSRMSS